MKEEKITIYLDDNRKVSGKGIMYEINLNQQRGKNLCWAAVTESIYKSFGDNGFTQDKFAKDIKDDEEEDPYELLEKIYKKNGKTISKCELKTKGISLTQKEFKYLIQKEGGPLIFTIPQDGKSCNWLHYVLVVGYINIKTIDHKGMHIIVKNPHPSNDIINRTNQINVNPTLFPFSKFKQCGVLYTTILDDDSHKCA
jgi:hypothetical protein